MRFCELKEINAVALTVTKIGVCMHGVTYDLIWFRLGMVKDPTELFDASVSNLDLSFKVTRV